VRQVVKYRAYEKALKDICKIKGSKLDKTIEVIVDKLVKDEHPGNFVHNLHRTSVDKSGLTGLKELHITGELLLIFRKVEDKLELVDICKNHKDLMKRY
jgi:mRNA-degrading endonuclease YafQ of YafQ-DinJ toxin-antitoxin module